MKFEQLLAQQQVPEWRTAYVPYAALKRQLKFVKKDVFLALEIIAEHQEQQEHAGAGKERSPSSTSSSSAPLSPSSVHVRPFTKEKRIPRNKLRRRQQQQQQQRQKNNVQRIGDSSTYSDGSGREENSEVNSSLSSSDDTGIKEIIEERKGSTTAPSKQHQNDETSGIFVGRTHESDLDRRRRGRREKQTQHHLVLHRQQASNISTSAADGSNARGTMGNASNMDSGHDENMQYKHTNGEARINRPHLSSPSSSSSSPASLSSSKFSPPSSDDAVNAHVGVGPGAGDQKAPAPLVATAGFAASNGFRNGHPVSHALDDDGKTSRNDDLPSGYQQNGLQPGRRPGRSRDHAIVACDDHSEGESVEDDDTHSFSSERDLQDNAHGYDNINSGLRQRHRPAHSSDAIAHRLLHRRGLVCDSHHIRPGSLVEKFKATGFMVVCNTDDDIGTIHSLGNSAQSPDNTDRPRFLLRELLAEQKFWNMVEKAIERVDSFYHDRMQDYIDRFHAFAARAVQLNLIPFFVPGASGKQSRIERELTRHKLPVRGYVYDELSMSAGVSSEEVYPIRIVVRTSILTELLRVKRMIKEFTEQGETEMLTPRDIKRTFQTNIKNTVLPFPVDDETITNGWRDPLEQYRPGNEVDQGQRLSKCNYVVRSCYCGFSTHLKSYTQHRQQLRRAVREFYRGLVLIEDFCTLNVEGFRKVSKKHDKELGTKTQKVVLDHVSHKTNFGPHNLVGVLKTETEALYARTFCQGHRTKAMDALRIPPPRDTSKVYWRMGFIIGLSLALVGAILYALFVFGTADDRDEFFLKSNDGNTRAILVLYRSIACATLMVWFWGFDMYVWEKYRLNYMFIFEFNPRKHVRFPHMLQAAGWFTLVVLVAFFLFIMSSWPTPIAGFSWLQEPNTYLFHPLALLIVALIVFALSQARADWWIVRTLARIVAAPFVGPVRFRDFFVGDQLLSIVIVLRDIEFMTCWFVWDSWRDYPLPDSAADLDSRDCYAQMAVAGPLVSALPVTWRFLQCLRRYRDSRDIHQLWNAGKYFSAYIVIVFSGLAAASTVALVIWIVSAALTTLYSAYWDFAMDWSLLSFHRDIHPTKLGFKRLISTKWFSIMRRTNTVYTFPFWLYYVAAVGNMLLRLIWVLTLSPGQFPIDAVLFSTILAGLEITRRAIWNLFRLENEQMSNIGKYRAIKDVPFVATSERLDYLQKFGLGLELRDEQMHEHEEFSENFEEDQHHGHLHPSHDLEEKDSVELDSRAASTKSSVSV